MWALVRLSKGEGQFQRILQNVDVEPVHKIRKLQEDELPRSDRTIGLDRMSLEILWKLLVSCQFGSKRSSVLDKNNDRRQSAQYSRSSGEVVQQHKSVPDGQVSEPGCEYESSQSTKLPIFEAQ